MTSQIQRLIAGSQAIFITCIQPDADTPAQRIAQTSEPMVITCRCLHISVWPRSTLSGRCSKSAAPRASHAAPRHWQRRCLLLQLVRRHQYMGSTQCKAQFIISRHTSVQSVQASRSNSSHSSRYAVREQRSARGPRSW